MRTLLDPVTGTRVPLYERADLGFPPSPAPRGRLLRPHALVHHGVGKGAGVTAAEAVRIWRGYRQYHVGVRGWTDIGYTHGWTDAGVLLEGRGWGRDGGHTQRGRNYDGYACCFVGDGRYTEGSPAAWAAWRAWLFEGMRVGALVVPPLVSPHSRWWPKVCAGNRIDRVVAERSMLPDLVAALRGPGRDWLAGASPAEVDLAVVDALVRAT